MRIGVDVGGTNTDAVLLDGERVVAACKCPTSADVREGIVAALRQVLDAAKGATHAIDCVMIGTTQFTNAFVERRNLLQPGIIRIALPSARGIPPLTDWPADLLAATGRHAHQVRGGYRFDGRENAPLDEMAVAAAAREFRAAGLRTVAVSSLFAPLDGSMERRAEQIVRNEMGDVAVTLSHNIGCIGLLERENAAIMNASLAALSRDVVGAFREALRDLHLDAPFYISQNDGTLMSADYVERYPVLTFASGPTNSMRGAARLSGLSNALVCDIGGTTSDIGMLVNGFPRESSVAVDVGGVRTNFRMPDVLALGLGGGSLVDHEGGGLRIGPRSVGFRLVEDALVFGGKTLTASDIAVAAGYARMGDASRVSGLPRALVESSVELMHRMLAEAVDRMKTSAEPLPLVLVGGGAVLVNREIPGVSEVIVPEHAGVANAIGAAIAQVGGEVDRVFASAEAGREAVLAAAKTEAIERAKAAGADPASIEVLDVEEMPLAYMPGGAVRVRVKVAGNLATAAKEARP